MALPATKKSRMPIELEWLIGLVRNRNRIAQWWQTRVFNPIGNFLRCVGVILIMCLIFSPLLVLIHFWFN